jgi:Glycosyl transferase family 11
MIVVKIQGGLGNQLFQYAFGKALADKYHDEVQFDLTTYQGKSHRGLGLTEFGLEIKEISPDALAKFFNLKTRALNKLGGKLGKQRTYFEKGFNYYPIEHNNKANIYYLGYWHSPKYFENINVVLKKELLLPDSKLPAQYLDEINNKPTVAIHIRKGDYLEVGNAKVYVDQPLEYYVQAVKHMENLASGCQYLVFSDDMDWVTANLNLPVKWQPVIDSTCSDVQVLMLMSKCRHQIIANSTYSWWAAWLNPNEGKHIIAPQKWFADGRDTSDLIPENWIKI